MNSISKYLLSPSSNINYDFIASAYGLFALLSLILYLLETQLFISAQYQEEQGNDTLKELAESTKGLYMIFIPFLPSFVWSLMMRYIWRGQKQNEQLELQTAEKKKKDN